MPAPQPQFVADQVQSILGALASSQTNLENELAAVMLDPAQFRRRAKLEGMLANVRRVLDQFGSDYHSWSTTSLAQIYASGALQTAEELGSQFSWTNPHLEAAQEIANRSYGEVLSRTQYVEDNVKSFIRSATKKAGWEKVLEGQTAVQEGRSLEDQLGDLGLDSIRYVNGASHTLGEYTQMLARTTSAQAYNNAALNQAPDTKYWEVLDGPNCGWTEHDDPETANGKITTIDDCLAWPISHPNCRRTFGPRPDIETPKDLKDAEPSTTFAQNQDQIAADQARADQRAKRSGKATSRKSAAQSKMKQRSSA